MTATSTNLLRHVRQLAAARAFEQWTDHQLLEHFAAGRDETMFALLVRRHGPMVLGLCRRLLGHEQNAEDAFQAVFLLLARKADSIRQADVGGWLYRVAYHVAVRARAQTAKRQQRVGAASRAAQGPARLAGPTSADPVSEATWNELQQIVDEEIQRLPEDLRSALVLCYLESKTQEEAARLLGWSKGTLRRRLDRGRELLRRRLIRRGLAPMAALTASLFADAGAPAAVTATLVTTTVRSAMSGTASASIVGLVEAGGVVMSAGKAKTATVLLLAASLLGGAGVYFLASPQRQQGTPLLALRAGEGKADTPRSAKPDTAKTAEIQGRVLDPDGKPVSGAKLVITYSAGKEIPHKVWAVSAADGRFAFAVPMKDVDDGFSEKPWEDTYVVAAAEGYGFAAAQVGKSGAAELTLRLVKDDVPIRGRIIDLEGKPVAGARIQIGNNMLGMPKKGDLTNFVGELKASKRTWWNHLTWLYSPAFDLLFPPVTTGADGRFVIKGIGRERIVQLRIEGPTIATQEVDVMTRAIETIQRPQAQDQPKETMVTYHGANCEFLAAPSRPVVGIVRDKGTGKPLAGAIVEGDTSVGHSRSGFIQTTTDKDGCYRLDGLPKADGNRILVRTNAYLPPSGNAMSNQMPYISSVKKVDNPLGLGPVSVDFALKRGIWVKGHITDKATGKPLRAGVEYYCFSDNPNAKEIAFEGRSDHHRGSREDGLFQIAVLPGHGLIAVRAYQDRYIRGVGADKIKGRRYQGQDNLFITVPYFVIAGNYNMLVEIDPKPGDESIRCDMALDPGRTLKGAVLDTDGKPLAGARIAGRKDGGFWEDNAGSDFTVENLKPNKLRVLQFVHEGRKLSGYLILRGDERDPIRVQLKPGGTLTGRVVTPSGKPLSSVRVNCQTQMVHQGQRLYLAEFTVYPDKDGRFRIDGLVAGVKYGLSVSRSNLQETIAGGNPKDLVVKPGEAKDLGDLRVKPME